MALSDYALTTLATLKTELGITGTGEDARLERLIEVASRRLIGLLNRAQLHYQVDRAESVRGFGTNVLRLQLAPLLAIDSITFSADGGASSSTIGATGYTIADSGLGWVLRLGGVWAYTGDYMGALPDPLPGTERPYYTVTYTGGYVTPKQVEDDALLTRTLPYDIEDACIALATQRYYDDGTGRDIKSERLLEGSVSYESARDSSGRVMLPSVVQAVVDAYGWPAL